MIRPEQSSGLNQWHEFLPELLGQPLQGPLFGLQDLGLVLREPVLDKLHAPLTMTRQNNATSLRAKAMVATNPPRRAAKRR
jgi:hypothetical protein